MSEDLPSGGPMPPALAALAAEAGILPRFRDLSNTMRETGADTARALLAAMGLPAGDEAEAQARLSSLRAASAARSVPPLAVAGIGAAGAARVPCTAAGDWVLTLEDGSVLEGRAEAPAIELPPLPMGIHDLRLGEDLCAVLAAPPALPLPSPGWGITAPFYGMRTAARGGLADYHDLAAAAASLGRAGAGFLGINPIHAGFPTDPAAISPYSPSSRRRFNILHVAAPGESELPGEDLVDWPPATAARLAALRARFAALDEAEQAALAAFRAEGGEALERFALHQALSEEFGPYWLDWPAPFRSPATPECRAWAVAHAEETAFHAWAQMEAERQLSAVAAAARGAGMAHGLYLDLAVGTHPAGAEAWADPGLFARGVSLGAPPDPFAPQGQSWGLAPMIPRALIAAGLRPLAETLRAQLRFAGLLRIDHILGFERAYWVPEGLPGAYVAMPREAMLAVARIEAARAGACIVGEDLGVVPEGLREALAASGLLGCRLGMFDRELSGWQEGSLGSFGTHDLPPYAGWMAGGDIAEHERLGHVTAGEAEAMRARRVDEKADLARRAGEEGVDAMHGWLARAPSRLVAVQIEDALGLAAQANLPGTVDSHPNWRRRTGIEPEALGDAEGVRRAAAIMRAAGR